MGDLEKRFENYEALMDAVVGPLMWCWAAIDQLDRLHAARREVVPVRGGDTPLKRERFWRMDVEAHFALVAVDLFRKSLSAVEDVDIRFAEMLTRFPVTLEHLRNALQHDDDRGYWRRGYGTRFDSNEWTDSGAGRLGEIIDDGDLRAELVVAYDELLAIERSNP